MRGLWWPAKANKNQIMEVSQVAPSLTQVLEFFFFFIDVRPSIPLVPGSGEIIETDHVIKFEGVPLVTPNGDVIIRSMDFEVKGGMNVLVCGPNGCGKSSLFRVLGEV